MVKTGHSHDLIWALPRGMNQAADAAASIVETDEDSTAVATAAYISYATSEKEPWMLDSDSGSRSDLSEK